MAVVERKGHQRSSKSLNNMEVYLYNAFVKDVYDADTATFVIDIGFKLSMTEKCRFIGIDTPEIRTKNKKEKELGLEARDFVREMILEQEVNVRTYKRGKFGRYLVDVYLLSGEKLNDILVEKGYAKRYDGGKRERWFS